MELPIGHLYRRSGSALAAGNTVIAKPAEQTSLIATYAVSLMHQAGIPTSALQLVLGAGDVGSALTGDTRIGGVIFTGSTEVARLINKALSKRDDNPVLIAETGGQKRDDCGLYRPAGTSLPRRIELCLRQRRPTLFRSTYLVCSRRCCR